MTDTHEPTTPAAETPALPPIDAVPLPAAGTRSSKRLVIGLILTILGGVLTLVGLAPLATELGAAENPGGLLGRAVGGTLIWIVVLVVGIVVLAKSKRK